MDGHGCKHDIKPFVVYRTLKLADKKLLCSRAFRCKQQKEHKTAENNIHYIKGCYVVQCIYICRSTVLESNTKM